jgi:hypothetical protein
MGDEVACERAGEGRTIGAGRELLNGQADSDGRRRRADTEGHGVPISHVGI